MARLLFRLNGVDMDEAEDVRQILEQAGIEFYETDAGRWRISLAALWLRHDEDYAQARALLDEYQQARAERMRAEAGALPGFWQRAQERPVDLVLVIIAISALLALMLWPFFSVGR